MKKNKKGKKKVSKKSVSKKTELVITVQSSAPTVEDLKPIVQNNKYSVAKTWISEKQIIQMVTKTPPQHIYKRPGKGGQTWSYVTGNYIEKVLNFSFGWNWDFEVISHGKEGDQIWVHGKLTVKDDEGHSVTKSQFGRADIKFKKDTKVMLDFGNDLKSATTDALKKCASLLGIASDIYGKTEIKQETGVEPVDPTPASNQATYPTKNDSVTPPELKKGQVIGPGGFPTYVCVGCDDPIADEVYNYSMKIYKKPYCRNCQISHKKQ